MTDFHDGGCTLHMVCGSRKRKASVRLLDLGSSSGHARRRRLQQSVVRVEAEDGGTSQLLR